VLEANPLDILVVDDEQSICLLLHDVLVRFGHRVATCQEGATALKLASERDFGLVFLDIRMPGMDGVQALQQLRKLRPNATYIMITGYAHDDIVEQSLRSGASACLCKPFSLTQVAKLLEQLSSGHPVPA
jgi:DNA-binding NtrC family response regulator